MQKKKEKDGPVSKITCSIRPSLFRIPEICYNPSGMSAFQRTMVNSERITLFMSPCSADVRAVPLLSEACMLLTPTACGVHVVDAHCLRREYSSDFLALGVFGNYRRYAVKILQILFMTTRILAKREICCS